MYIWLNTKGSVIVESCFINICFSRYFSTSVSRSSFSGNVFKWQQRSPKRRMIVLWLKTEKMDVFHSMANICMHVSKCMCLIAYKCTCTLGCLYVYSYSNDYNNIWIWSSSGYSEHLWVYLPPWATMRNEVAHGGLREIWERIGAGRRRGEEQNWCPSFLSLRMRTPNLKELTILLKNGIGCGVQCMSHNSSLQLDDIATNKDCIALCSAKHTSWKIQTLDHRHKLLVVVKI